MPPPDRRAVALVLLLSAAATALALAGLLVATEGDSGRAPAARSPGPLKALVSPRRTPTPLPASSDGKRCAGVAVRAGADVAAAVRAAPAGATLCLAAGSYPVRDPVSPRAGQTVWGAPGTVLDGSRRVRSWTRDGADWRADGALPAAYQGTGQCEDTVTDPCRLAEQLWRDGKRLRRVMSRDAVAPGTFYADYSVNRLYVGDDPSGHRLEIDRTAKAITALADDVTIRGLTVQRFASDGQAGAVEVEGHGIEVLDNTIRDNHAVGLKLANADRARVHDNSIIGNGQLGLAQYRSHDTYVTRNEIALNNTEGFWVADWESGGFKVSYSDRAVYERNDVHDNAGIGMWADLDNRDTTFRGNVTEGNAADGIRFEISYGGTIEDNTVRYNGLDVAGRRGTPQEPSLYAVAGITVHSSDDVQVRGNTVTGNLNGIGLQQRDRGEGRDGVYELRNVWVHDNTVTLGRGRTGLVQNVGDSAYFRSKLNRFTDNTYVLPSEKSPSFAWADGELTAKEWRAAGQDRNGRFTVAASRG